MSLSQRQKRTGNCLLPFCTETVDKHVGAPVFFSGLSSAQTFNTGSFSRSSAIVTSNDVPSICLRCVIDPASCALNDCMILNVDETTWTTPSVDPRKRVAEPVHRDERSG